MKDEQTTMAAYTRAWPFLFSHLFPCDNRPVSIIVHKHGKKALLIVVFVLCRYDEMLANKDHYSCLISSV
jgi:hypothetical protein